MEKETYKLTGPFSQILTMDGINMHGPVSDDQLVRIENGGILTKAGRIEDISNFEVLKNQYPDAIIERIDQERVLLPGFIDCHTHICFGGSRAKDYSLRIQGKSYLEIAKSGGGIWDSVQQTRKADIQKLEADIISRANRHLHEGVTTIEVKSGYGLDLEHEIKQLTAIKNANQRTRADLISTCLAAHLHPKDFDGDATAYLEFVCQTILPEIGRQKLSNRVDIFIEQSAFSVEEAIPYLNKAAAMGFDLTVHADQFSTGGLKAAIQVGAISADHLEASGEAEAKLLNQSPTVAVVLPGASLGLGMSYAPARLLLDNGACVAIASDWNPGSAPMGDLLMQAAVLSASEKLTTAEVFAALTFRAAKALNVLDKGVLTKGMVADMQSYPTADYRDILYYQGKLKPAEVWKDGTLVTKQYGKQSN